MMGLKKESSDLLFQNLKGSCRHLTTGLHGAKHVVMAAILHISQTGLKNTQSALSVAVCVNV